MLGLTLAGSVVPIPPAAAAGERSSVVACDSLVALRQLSAASGDNREIAATRVPAEPGCRLVAREAVGPVERRAMFGGAPYECMTIVGAETCLWVMP